MVIVTVILVMLAIMVLVFTQGSKETFAFTTFVKSKPQDTLRAEMELYRKKVGATEQDTNCFVTALLLASYKQEYADAIAHICQQRLTGELDATAFMTEIAQYVSTTSVTMKDWHSACQYVGDYAVQNGFSSNDFTIATTSIMAAAVITATASDDASSSDSFDGGGGGGDF
ncbi:hypothetical protein CH76_07820 [Lysinibacillus sp. BF-4]|uniref:hypothetical protein n=1 Tax=Lysinibacillus sp. BF-4 TaxID=1473546 RepID=UPI000501BE1A|nr:hypothetical protein [Lysinibacillus sp. BF-4]KFL43207.1 hypothetical protein CH76_07820 [Lysinibacillus sp. BF-4]